MQKSVLRKQFNALRKQLTQVEIEQNSILITESFFTNFDLTKVNYLHIFLAIPEKGEVNTHLIIQKIWVQFPHIQVVSSKTDFENNTLSHYELNPNTKLIQNTWGITEPINSVQVSDNQLDMILIPLLCFDESGYRVGYGKGFYDRFLANCRADTLKIGLSFFPPIQKIEDLNEFDIALNYCITPSEIWQFNT
jgi:5-formyltetrahydrofolate cyclo-ligase